MNRVAAFDEVAELRKTLHISAEDVPYIENTPGLASRVLHARKDEPLLVTELCAQPGAMSGLHRHVTPVLGWTIEGAWGHNREYLYRPGTYIYETPGVIHRFMNGPAVSRVIYIQSGDVENIDPETREVISVNRIPDRIDRYFEACEAAGLPRPNVLS